MIYKGYVAVWRPWKQGIEMLLESIITKGPDGSVDYGTINKGLIKQ